VIYFARHVSSSQDQYLYTAGSFAQEIGEFDKSDFERGDSPMTGPASNPNDRTEEFMRLLGKHERRLEGFVISLVPNWADDEEVLQETKLQLWQQYDKYDATKDFGAWACTLAYYRALTMRKRSPSQHATLSIAFLEKVAAEAARDSAQVAHRHQLLADCLKKLSQAKQSLLKRCYGSQDTIVQIASELGKRADSVRQELVRVRRRLYQCVENARRREESL
jgi:RNA polymerase sigma-70 factor, ECF subfamily